VPKGKDCDRHAGTHLLRVVRMVVRVLLLWSLLLLLLWATVHVLLRVPDCQAVRVHLRGRANASQGGDESANAADAKSGDVVAQYSTSEEAL